MNTRGGRNKLRCLQTSLTFKKKSTKSEDYRCFNFLLFVFVTLYLTSSRPAAPTLIYQKPTHKKNAEKQNKQKKINEWKINITASGFLDFNFLSSRFWNQEEFSFLLSWFYFSVYRLLLFSSSELTLTFLFLDLGDLTERHRLAAVNNVSTVWCIRFLSALAQTCGPFLLCLHIMFLFIKQEKTFKKKKRFYIHLSPWTLAQRIHCMIPGMSVFLFTFINIFFSILCWGLKVLTYISLSK